jgi:hypothetical protein
MFMPLYKFWFKTDKGQEYILMDNGTLTPLVVLVPVLILLPSI